MPQTRVVITGLGILSCIGTGRRAFWDALREGRSGIRPIDRFDASDLPCQIAGQLWDFDPADFMRRNVVRKWFSHVHQAVASAKLAVEDAELNGAGYAEERIGTAFGTSVGEPNEVYEAHQEALESGGYKALDRLTSSKYSGHSATVHVTIDNAFRGPAMTIASGCSTGLDTLSWGVDQIRAGRLDAAVVGATECPIFPMSLASACSLGICSKRNDAPDKAMRPFDRHRDGMVLSEGAAALVLEREDHARARGAQIFCEVTGMGSASEGVNALILDKNGVAMARAILLALEQAGAIPEDIDHIQAHGVSLEMYDHCETNAYKRALGDHARRVPISGIKSMMGQAYAAAGLFGVGAAILALTEGVVSPTVNLEHPDPVCDLDYVPLAPRLNDPGTALVSSMSFGGTHSAALLQRVS
jgi:3-oxoacyl-[acyl-carrier-protein] synthase II